MSDIKEVKSMSVLIRCAMQTFPDWEIPECSLDWTVLELKKHLSLNFPTKPEVSHQRLIYAGQLMTDKSTLRHFLLENGRMANRASNADKKIVHLVYMPQETLSNNEGLRYRAPHATITSTSVRNGLPSGSTAQQSATHQYFSVNSSTSSGIASIPSSYTNFALGLNASLPSQEYQQYVSYMSAYQAYINSIVQCYQHGGYHYYQPQQIDHHQQSQNAQLHSPFYSSPELLSYQYQHMLNATHQFGLPAIQQQIPMGNAQALPQINPNPVPIRRNEAEEAIPPPDVLDIVYKAIRFLLLMMLLYVYSSWERFLFVLLAVLVMWWLQRARRQQAQDMAVPVQQQNLIRAQPELPNAERGQTNDETGQNDQQNPHHDMTSHQQVQAQTSRHNPSAWFVFWSTVTAFFTSLVPEQQHEIPAN